MTDTTKTDLLQAASKLLAEQGPAALTVRRIAESAGTTTMGVYSRFGGKDGILEALYLEGFSVLAAAQKSVEEGATGMQRLRGLCGIYRRTALDFAAHYRLMMGESVPGFEPSPAARQVGLSAFGRLMTACQQAIDDGALRAPAPAAAYAIWTTCHGLVAVELSGMVPDGVDREAAYWLTLEGLLAGLAPG